MFYNYAGFQYQVLLNNKLFAYAKKGFLYIL